MLRINSILPLNHPDQYRATIMIATTSNEAISQSARSKDLDRNLASSGERMTQLPLDSIISGSAPLGKCQSMTVSGMTKQTSLFKRVDPLRTRWHIARFLEGIDSAGVLVAAVRRGFLLHDVRSYAGGTGKLYDQP
jgi:hypothetical protein